MVEIGQDLFRIEKFALKFVGITLTRQNNVLYKIYSLTCITLFIFFYPVVLFADLIQQKFVEALDTWAVFLSFTMVLCTVLMTFYNRVQIGSLLSQLSQKPFISKFHEERIATWERFKNIQALVLVFAMILAVISQILFSLVLRLTKRDPNEWKLGYGRITIMNISYSPNFEIFYIYQSVSVMYGMVSYVVITILITGVFDYIATQFKILQIELSNILYKSSPIREKITTWGFVHKQVKNFVSYHIQVSKAVDQVTDIFSEVIFCMFIGIVTVICVDVYRASKLPMQEVNAFRILLEAIIGSFCTLLVCNAGENLTQESERMLDFAYDVDFVGTDLRFQKSLVIIMRKSQEPIRLKAGKFIDISLVTFAWIMRASYSLYAMLQTTNNG